MESLGTHLKRERELRDISLHDVAEATKINLRYIEAIEADQFEALPGKTFVIGFLKNYAGYIGLDGDEVVTRYLDFENATEVDSPKKTKKVIEGEKKKSIAGPVFIIILFLIAASIIYFFFNMR